MTMIPYSFDNPFKVGDKVICINEECKSKNLEKGKIYTVKESVCATLNNDNEIVDLITVEEISLPPKIGFRASKFEKINYASIY